MIETDFGQIKIYEELFHDFNTKTIKRNIVDCIEYGFTYSGLYKNKEFPIMVGSKFDTSINPFNFKGFFIIDGKCKSINNIKQILKPNYSKDTVYLKNGERIKIIDMFNYSTTVNNKSRKWYIPINYKEICKYSKNKKELENFFEICNKVNKTNKNKTESIKEEIDMINICYMFECWLNLRKEPKYIWRLITPGEILYNCLIKDNNNVVEYFRVNSWKIFGFYSNSISEDLKHYNEIGDSEAIRRITIFKNRENVQRDKRIVTLEDKGKLCPVQTSDGAICGTVNYLCKNAKVSSKVKQLDVKVGNDIHLLINNIYIGKIYVDEIDRLKNNGYIINKVDIVCYAYNNYGFVINGEDVSETANLIKYRKHNPPIRAMFATSMIKQCLMPLNEKIRMLVPSSKMLLKDTKPLKVGIMPWYGYNLEDGIVISKKVSENFRYKYTKIYRSNNVDVVDIYIKKNSKVTYGDALYKTFSPSEIKSIEIIYSEHNGIVENIIIKEKYIKIIISESKSLKVGDKMTNYHGQKGVISLILNENDMPYYYENDEKIKLELLINPHSFPSRMTMGQIIEMGNNEKHLWIQNKPIKNKIIVGDCKYIALRHQVDDKMQYRNSGRFDMITKQPLKGRKNNGGLRFGQMERDILIGLDAWNTINELWSIDKTKVGICPKSGIFNPKCCKKEIEISQSFLICLSYMRCIGHDIILKNNKYSICKLDKNILQTTDTLKFGDISTEVKYYEKEDLVILPMSLRSNKLNSLYLELIKYGKNENKIEKEIRVLLKSKNGVFHKYIEGHIVDRCVRSVITPNPELGLDEVYIPIEANIGCKYGILNRQPSLNKESIKIVKLKYHNNKSISFNPLLCKQFNADFDGDEMNIYGIKNIESINELKEKIKTIPQKTQDYILGDLKEITEEGVTANKKGIKIMIDNGSKGTMNNYDYMYNNINNTNENFNDGLSDDNWYMLSIEARENIISIALNTPITGSLLSLCIQRLL